MPCHSCFAEFGLLKREIGCEVCGFSFCPRCCKKRHILSDTGDIKRILCNTCYEKISEKSKPKSISPPLAHKKRMEALKKQSFSVDSGYNIPSLKNAFDDEKDKELDARLKKLRRERMKDELPSELEIEERLAKLKGIDPSKYKAPPIEVFRPSDKRTSTEKANDLLTQMKEEVDLDSQLVRPEDEIAERLARLRSESPSEKPEQSASEQDLSQNSDKKGSETESDIEEEANKLVEKFMATNIDDEVEELESSDGQDEEKTNFQTQEEEFPWCTICTEDAKIRCFDCDGDLYCMICFKECHDSFDMTDHKTCPFLPSKKTLL